MKLKKLTLAFAVLLSAAAGPAQAQNTDGDSTTIEEQDQSQGRAKPATHLPTYWLRKRVEIPLVAAGTAWTLFGFSQVYNKPNSSLQEIQALKKEDLNSFDRWAAGMSSKDADIASNYPFYGSIPAPIILMFADKAMKGERRRLAFLYLEAMAITGTLYTSATYFVDRYRPETYDPAISEGDRQGGNYKNSFFAGHVANVATITFFTAKIYNDYHPGNPWRWAFWGGAAAATATTAYLRHEAGKHWPSDILLGAAVGVASGVLVPHLHKNPRTDGRGFSIAPLVGPANGVTMAYRF
jgi:membrane-associated phospholipid phosphatase